MMIAALILVFALLNMSAQWAAAFVGGVGFGFFIDEVGKFISNDVNYFFEPAFAVMYVVFIILFFALWAIRRAALRPHDALANALSLLREERDGTLDAETKREILLLLDRADPADALVPVLRERVRATPTIEQRNLRYARWQPAWPSGTSTRPSSTGSRRSSWWSRSSTASRSLGTVVSPFTGQRRCRRRRPRLRDVVRDRLHQASRRSSSASASPCGAARGSRRHRWFKAGILVSLLITQVFVFYYDGFSALVGVIVDLLLYAALSYMIAREEAHERGVTATWPRTPTPRWPQAT